LAARGRYPGACIACTVCASLAHTRITFIVDAVGWPQTQGRFTNFQGKIAIDFDNPRASNVSFKVAANSIDAGSSSLNDYLRWRTVFQCG
jgi:polyisoprenoid-binding protein YceI